MSASRTRWAALGAAVAVSIGAGGVGLVNASIDDGERTVFVPIEPCRLVDTRSDTQVGDTTTLQEDDAVVIDAHGEQGDCDLPEDASGVSLNVTAVDPSEQTNLRIYPTPDDDSVPLTASLNPFPGLPQEFNSVVTDLNDDGQFSVYNRFGTVDIVIDVAGYYADHTHDDRYYTEDEMQAVFPLVVYESSETPVTGVGAAAVILTADITASAAGIVVAQAVASVTPGAGVTEYACSLSPDSSMDTLSTQTSTVVSDTDDISVMAAFEVAADEELTVNLVCESTGGTSTITNPQMTATFTGDIGALPTVETTTTTTSTTIAET